MADPIGHRTSKGFEIFLDMTRQASSLSFGESQTAMRSAGTRFEYAPVIEHTLGHDGLGTAMGSATRIAHDIYAQVTAALGGILDRYDQNLRACLEEYDLANERSEETFVQALAALNDSSVPVHVDATGRTSFTELEEIAHRVTVEHGEPGAAVVGGPDGQSIPDGQVARGGAAPEQSSDPAGATESSSPGSAAEGKTWASGGFGG